MTVGAPDHHSTVEVKIDELIVSMCDVKDAINNLKATLTNLNVKPPVAETPWAFKLIGKAATAQGNILPVTPLAYRNLVTATGSGQLLALRFQTQHIRDEGRDGGNFRIKIDGHDVYNDTLREIFGVNLTIAECSFGTWGVTKNDSDIYICFLNLPLHYSTGLQIDFRNMDALADSTVAWWLAYTNLPAP